MSTTILRKVFLSIALAALATATTDAIRVAGPAGALKIAEAAKSAGAGDFVAAGAQGMGDVARARDAEPRAA